MRLFPECDFSHVAGFSVVACVAQQFSVFRETVDVSVFDSDVVDDGHCFTRNIDIQYYYPALRAPLLK